MVGEPRPGEGWRAVLAQQPQRPGLVAALRYGGRGRELGALTRVFQATSQQIRFAEAGDHGRQKIWSAIGDRLLYPCSARARPSATRLLQRIRHTQGCSP